MRLKIEYIASVKCPEDNNLYIGLDECITCEFHPESYEYKDEIECTFLDCFPKEEISKTR